MSKEKISKIINETSKAITGKEEIIKRVLTVILAKGHVLLEDIPGVGKTTLALAICKSIGMEFGRVQFTPDVVPSDITGFTIFDKETGRFEYQEGAVMCNLFLADEINIKEMQDCSVITTTYRMGENTGGSIGIIGPTRMDYSKVISAVGTAGTQLLPEAQLDRFMMKVSMGYPTFDEQVKILKLREGKDPLDDITSVVSIDELLNMLKEVNHVFTDEKIYRYITSLTEETRKNEYIRLGISPRGAISLAAAARAWAYIEGRDYVIPEDIDEIFIDVCSHRLVMEPKAKLDGVNAVKVLEEIKNNITAPKTDGNLKI